MEQLLMNFEFNTEFFIMIGMFLTITFMITIIIVYFMTKLNALSSFLEQAKDIDDAKKDRISTLEMQLQEEKIYNINIMKKLEDFEKNKKALSEKEKEIEGLKENINHQSQKYIESFSHQEISFKELHSQYKLLHDKYTSLVEKHRLLQKRNETLVQENNTFHTRLRETKVQLNQQEKQTSPQIVSSTSMVEGDKTLFERNKKRISSMIKPLKPEINDLKKRVEILLSNSAKERVILKQEILSLKELNYQIGQDGIRLTHALRGSNQQQGIWGDAILEKILHASGLGKGIEYRVEPSLDNDIVVHLPDKRDLVINAKVPLNSYVKYFSEQQPEAKERQLQEHIKEIKAHIKRLRERSYELGANSLDFIFLLFPIEGALSVALEKEKSLYDEAFKNQILLVSSSTLLIAMRAVENVWKYNKQNQNAQEIASLAGLLHEKFLNLSDEVTKISK